jgi:Circularly permutated YpsA SLOG family
MLQQIISGCQTGVDRAALDAALECGFPCGGWCPAGRKAEDGPIPARYPLVELRSANYLARTAHNVRESDATLVLTFGAPSGGTARTVEFCRQYTRPVLVVDGEQVVVQDAVSRVVAFIVANQVGRLNVAGPRGYGFALAVVRGLIEAVRR